VRPYVIAELSANHLGNLDRAVKIVEAAAKAGASAVKLQTWKPGTMVGNRDYVLPSGPWKGRKLADLYEDAHTPWEWHAPLFERARALGMEAFSSVFDHESLAFLETLNPPRYKIASFELVDVGLIERVARTGKPLILSCGMATEEEVDGWLDAGLPHFMLRGRHLVYDVEALTWCAQRLARTPVEPHAWQLPDRANAAVTTRDVDALAWDVGELRHRGALSRPRARGWIVFLEDLRKRVVAEEQVDRDEDEDRFRDYGEAA